MEKENSSNEAIESEAPKKGRKPPTPMCRKCKEPLFFKVVSCPICGIKDPGGVSRIFSVLMIITLLVGATIGQSKNRKAFDLLKTIFYVVTVLYGIYWRWGGDSVDLKKKSSGPGGLSKLIKEFSPIFRECIFGALFGLGFAYVFTLLVGLLVKIFHIGFFVASMGVTYGIIVIVGMAIDTFQNRRKVKELEKVGIITHENLYLEKIEDEKKRILEIDDIIFLISQQARADDWQEKQLETLRVEKSALQANIDRYTRDLARNSLIHWGRWVKALADGIDRLTKKQCRERATALETLRSYGEELYSDWKDDEGITSAAEGREYLDILEKGIHTCDIIFEDVRDRLVILAADGVTKLSSPGVSIPVDRDAIDDFHRFIKESSSGAIFSERDRL